MNTLPTRKRLFFNQASKTNRGLLLGPVVVPSIVDIWALPFEAKKEMFGPFRMAVGGPTIGAEPDGGDSADDATGCHFSICPTDKTILLSGSHTTPMNLIQCEAPYIIIARPRAKQFHNWVYIPFWHCVFCHGLPVKVWFGICRFLVSSDVLAVNYSSLMFPMYPVGLSHDVYCLFPVDCT